MAIFHEIYVLLRLAGLHFFGLFGRAGVSTLIGGLNEIDERIVKLAEEKLRRMGNKATPGLIKALRRKDSVIPRRAARLLQHSGAEAVEPLMAVLSYDSEIDRRDAIATLGTLGPHVEKAIPSLILTLKDSSQLVRSQAKSTLKGIGPAAQRILLDKLTDCADTDHELAYQISDTLAGFKKPIVPDLIELVRKGSETARYHAMRTLRLIGRDAIPDLIVLLRDQSPRIRITAAKTLEMMDRKAKDAIPALIELMDDPNEDVRFRAAFALGVIGAELSIFAPVLEALTMPLEGYDAFNLYHRSHAIDRAHITETHPIVGEMMYDRLGFRFLCPEEDDRGGDLGCILLKGSVIRTASYRGDLVRISGFYEKKSGLLVASIVDADKVDDWF